MLPSEAPSASARTSTRGVSRRFARRVSVASGSGPSSSATTFSSEGQGLVFQRALRALGVTSYALMGNDTGGWNSRELALLGTRDVLADNAGRPGHIFNLGHGVHPETDPEVLAAVVEFVHESTSG